MSSKRPIPQYYKTYEIGGGMSLKIGLAEKGFSQITLVDAEGDRLQVSMAQLLKAVEAVYYHTKEKAQ